MSYEKQEIAAGAWPAERFTELREDCLCHNHITPRGEGWCEVSPEKALYWLLQHRWFHRIGQGASPVDYTTPVFWASWWPEPIKEDKYIGYGLTPLQALASAIEESEKPPLAEA